MQSDGQPETKEYLFHFGLALLSVALICFQYFIIGVITTLIRSHIFFNEKFWESSKMFIWRNSKVKERHPKEDIQIWEINDTPKNLHSINCSNSITFKRCHYNYLEQLTHTIVMLLISRYFNPFAASILPFMVFVGRVFYTIRYLKSSNKRVVGAILVVWTLYFKHCKCCKIYRDYLTRKIICV